MPHRRPARQCLRGRIPQSGTKIRARIRRAYRWTAAYGSAKRKVEKVRGETSEWEIMLEREMADASNKRKWKIQLLTVCGLNERRLQPAASRPPPLFTVVFFFTARREFPHFPRSSRQFSRPPDERTRGRIKKKRALNDTTDDITLRESRWETREITDYYDSARMHNGYLRAVITTTETHNSIYRVRFVRLARAHDNVIACDQRVFANLLIAIITAGSRKRLIKRVHVCLYFLLSLKACEKSPNWSSGSI